MKRLLNILPPWILTITVSAIILYLTLVPRPVPDDINFSFPGIDKIVHGLMFAALAGSIVIDRARYTGRHTVATKSLFAAAIIASAAGGAIEILQRVMAMGRGCELADFLADISGAFAGAWIGKAIVRWLLAR